MMELKKDMQVELEIVDMSVNGEGIGKINSIPLFVKDAIVGDTVEVKIMKMKKNLGYGRLLKILKPSKDRVEPVCPVHRQCGGCQIQSMDYKAQLLYKQQKVKNNLMRIGGFQDPKVEETIGMEVPYHYRNKAQYPVGKDKEGNLIAGFYANRTHSIIPMLDCEIGSVHNKEILETILKVMEQEHIQPYDENNRTGLIRHILIREGVHTNELMVCLVLNGDTLKGQNQMVESLKKIPNVTSISININKKNTNVILGDVTKTIYGPDTITDYIGNLKFEISPASFFQVNPVQTKVLYDLALEYAGLTGEETVWDLYCGIGTISLFLAQKAKKVFGVEIVEKAIEDAKNNAKENHIENVEFFTGKAEEVYPSYCKEHGEEARARVIVVDPPRKGCEASLLSMMCEMAPEKIVYVSCDSASLARDLKYLCEHGYELKKIQPVDQFCHTVHVETVCCLQRVNM